MKKGKYKKSRITGKQRAARQRNIKIARLAKKKVKKIEIKIGSAPGKSEMKRRMKLLRR